MKKALLCVSFGTSVIQARESITAVENTLRREMPEADFYRAFTSKTIRKILQERGEIIWSLEEALDELSKMEYDQVLVQPTHFLYGLEYERILACAEKKKAAFSRFLLGAPLLSHTEDLIELTKVLSKSYPEKPGQAIVFMGHGTPHFSNVVYPALQQVFHILGRPDMFVGTVEGWPEIDEVVKQLKKGKFASVCTAPLMLVAGDHAINDMAGDEPDSWKSILQKEGFAVECVLSGMGMDSGVQEMYRAHFNRLKESLES